MNGHDDLAGTKKSVGTKGLCASEGGKGQGGKNVGIFGRFMGGVGWGGGRGLSRSLLGLVLGFGFFPCRWY